MNVREFCNKNRSVIYVAVFLLVALAALIYEMTGDSRTPSDLSTKAYFTTEDQLTGADALQALFVDDATKAPPFDHNGKPAYLALVYCCDGGKVKWISYLKRYTPEMRKQVQASQDAAVASGAKYAVPTSDFDRPGTEVKRPGAGPWIKPSDEAFDLAKTVIVPDGAPSDDLDLCVPH